MRTLSITLPDDVYDRIKHAVPPRQISKFIAEAVEKKLNEQADKLYRAYLLANQDSEREQELKDWDVVNTEHWEKP